MSNKLYTVGALVIALVLFGAVNIIANTRITSARLDLTDHKLFTLSQGTLNTVRGLEEPVNIKLYLSQKLATRLPSVSGYADRVRELLGEYALASEGKVNLTIIDPEPFSEEEDRAVSLGLQGIPISNGESTFYFGIVGTNGLDDIEQIPYLTTEREEFLEYDVTKLIYALGNPKRKVIGLLSTLPIDGMSQRAAMGGQQPQPWMILEQMEQIFEVQRIATTVKAIPQAVDVLMLVHPKNFSDTTLYAIDQFVLAGGRIVAFVDPNAEADAAQAIRGMPALPQASQLSKLLGAWGVDLDTTRSVGDLQLAMRVRSQRGDRTVTAEYPPWLNIPSQLQNPDDIVTGKLGNLTFGSAGALTPRDDATTTFTPLVRSTDGAMLIKNELIGPLADLEHLKREYRPDGQQYVLAARVQGPVKSAFDSVPQEGKGDGSETKDGKKAATERENSATHLTSAQDINLIIVADTDFLTDQFWVQVQGFMGQRMVVPIAANANLVINALENLSGSADLISVRSRGRFLRPFTRVNALRQDAELKFREKEVQLLKRLETTEKRLTELQTSEGEGALVMSEAQRQEIDNFRVEKVRIRKDLREVRRELHKDIATLEGWLKFINIGLVPILIAVGGLLLGAYRLRRRRVVRGAAA
jgi:ABC-type uncharacterized transport system involved in gliding motility auxiliary subunit